MCCQRQHISFMGVCVIKPELEGGGCPKIVLRGVHNPDPLRAQV